MTFREKFNNEQIWHRKVLILELYHNTMLLRSHGKWNQRLTASRMQISLGSVNENLTLARAIRNNSELENCKTKKEALLIVRSK